VVYVLLLFETIVGRSSGALSWVLTQCRTLPV